jgi:hypothetical protein
MGAPFMKGKSNLKVALKCGDHGHHEEPVSRYSQLYIDQSAPLPDSARARHRLGKLIQSMLSDTDARALSGLLERELGVEVGAYHAYHFSGFLREVRHP